MRARDLFLGSALAAAAWSPCLSQSNPHSPPRFGVIAGANLATFSGDFLPKKSRPAGFAGGLMAVFPVSQRFAIQPEFMFTMKGAHSDSGGVSSTARINFVELPVLARFDIAAFGRVRPFVYGGPGFSYRTSCTLAGRTAPTSTNEFEIDTAFACDYLTSRPYPPTPGARYMRTDVDGIIGGGLAFEVGGRAATVSLRYDAGFMKVVTFSDSRNRVLSFIGTLEWPFHK